MRNKHAAKGDTPFIPYSHLSQVRKEPVEVDQDEIIEDLKHGLIKIIN